MNKCINVAMTQCFWCGEASGIAIGKTLVSCNKKWNNKYIFDGYEPCNKCQEGMNSGFTIMKAKTKPNIDNQPEIQKDVYPTGTLFVIKNEAAIEMFGEEVAKGGKAFMDTETLIEIGLIDK